MTTPNEQAQTSSKGRQRDSNCKRGIRGSMKAHSEFKRGVHNTIVKATPCICSIGKNHDVTEHVPDTSGQANTKLHSELAPQTTPSKADLRAELEAAFADKPEEIQITKTKLLDVTAELITTTLTQYKDELLAGLPKPKDYKEAEDTADHWGLTDTSIARQIDNMKASGFNEALAEVTAIINRGKDT